MIKLYRNYPGAKENYEKLKKYIKTKEDGFTKINRQNSISK